MPRALPLSSSSRADSRRRRSGPTRCLSGHSCSCRPTQARTAEPAPLASPRRRHSPTPAIAVVVLDAIAGRGRPRIAIAGDAPVSPARPLVRTAAVRVEEQAGVSPSLPGVPTQLVDLGPAVRRPRAGTLSRARDRGHHVDDHPTRTTSQSRRRTRRARSESTRLGQLGRATEALLSSLDASVGGAFRTPDSLFIGDRAASGWTVRLVLVLGSRSVRAGPRRPARSRTSTWSPVRTGAARSFEAGSASCSSAGSSSGSAR